MGQPWKTQIIILIAMNFPDTIFCSPLDDTPDPLNYPVDFVYPEDDAVNDQFAKRLSSFVRIGRGLSSFIRIGKNAPGYGEYPLETGDGDDLGEGYPNGNSAFVRIEDEPEAEKRLSSFVRIGKSGDDNDPYYSPIDKRGGAFIRLGKFPSAAFVRNRSGRIHSIASPPYYRRSGRIGHSSFIRIGKRDTRDAVRLAQANNFDDEDLKNYLDYKEDVEQADQGTGPMSDVTKEDEKRMSSFVRIGRQGDGYIPDDIYGKSVYNDLWTAPEAKRMSKFVRIGKNGNGEDIYKRMSSFVRIGKGYGGLNNKRMSSFVRIGKSNTDEFIPEDNKRMSKFVRIGKAMEVPNEDFNAEKRFSKFVRIGKNLENSIDQNEQQQDKRLSSFVRIGKSDNEKRMSKFVRIGKASHSDTNSADAIQTDVNEDLSKEIGMQAE